MIIKSGILHDGDIVVSGPIFGKVRAMTNDLGKRIDTTGPSMAAELIGLSEVPEAEDKFSLSKRKIYQRLVPPPRPAVSQIVCHPRTLSLAVSPSWLDLVLQCWYRLSIVICSDL